MSIVGMIFLEFPVMGIMFLRAMSKYAMVLALHIKLQVYHSVASAFFTFGLCAVQVYPQYFICL